MNDSDNNFDLFGTKDITKYAGKTLDKLTDGLGEFIKIICKPAAEEFGLLIKDKIAYYRIINLYKISEKVKKKVKERDLNFTGNMSPRLLKEIVENSSYCEDDGIKNMWAGLIANSSTNPNATDDTLIYIDTLKKMTSFQACLLNLIYSDPRACSISPPLTFFDRGDYNPQNVILFYADSILNAFPGDLTDIVPIHNTTHDKIINDINNHGIAIGRLKPQIENLKSLNLIHEVIFLEGKKLRMHFMPNVSGLDFYMRCLGYSLYPLESFILTLQHWCSLKNIDPFTFKIDNAT